MNPLIIALMLIVTIAAALGFGVVLGFAAINGILRAMRRQPQPEGAFAASEASASSGD